MTLPMPHHRIRAGFIKIKKKGSKREGRRKLKKNEQSVGTRMSQRLKLLAIGTNSQMGEGSISTMSMKRSGRKRIADQMRALFWNIRSFWWSGPPLSYQWVSLCPDSRDLYRIIWLIFLCQCQPTPCTSMLPVNIRMENKASHNCHIWLLPVVGISAVVIVANTMYYYPFSFKDYSI